MHESIHQGMKPNEDISNRVDPVRNWATGAILTN
jgi:hypothetical protein